MSPKATPFSSLSQKALSTLLLFLDGSFFSLSVFTVPVSRASSTFLGEHWSWGMAIMTFVAIPFMSVAGILLNAAKPIPLSFPADMSTFFASKTGRVRILSLFSSVCIAALLFTSFCIRTRKSVLLAAIVAIQGIPFNIYFLLSLELLTAWSPVHPGLAVGIGQMAFGLGSIFAAAVYEELINRLGVIQAIIVSTAVLSIVSSVLSCFLIWPAPSSCGERHEDREQDLTMQCTLPLSFQNLLQIPSFWLYISCLFSTQIGFLFIPYYFNIGLSFGKPMHVVIKSYETMFLAATLLRPVIGVMCDNFKFGTQEFSMGSKNVAVLMLFAQGLFFLLLIPISNHGSYIGFVIATTVVFVSFSAGECVAPILSRDMFGPANSAVVFGIGGSISFGLGELFAAELVSIFVSSESLKTKPSSYNWSYFLAFISTGFGLFATIMISRYGEALRAQTHSRNVKGPRVGDHATHGTNMVSPTGTVVPRYGAIAL